MKILKPTLAAVLFLAGLLLTLPQSEHASIVSPASTPEVHMDSQVVPARAEMDLSATRLGNVKSSSKVRQAFYEASNDFSSKDGVFRDSQVRLCQGQCSCQGGCSCGAAVSQAGFVDGGFVDGGVVTDGFVGNAHSVGQAPFVQAPFAGQAAQGPPSTPSLASKLFRSAGAFTGRTGRGLGREARWASAGSLPWEKYSFGEYIGPFRTPHVPEYRLRVDDQLEFVYVVTRRQSTEAYRFFVGDMISISSSGDPNLNQASLQILSDGTISLPLIGIVRVAGKTISNLQRELNDRYADGFVKNPEIVVQVLQGNTPLEDLLRAVDARAGQGGQSRLANVAPDGTAQLPLVGSVPVVGLTLREISREVNARYRILLGPGVETTAVLVERAPRFIYVVGEVDEPGQFELTGPTSAIQAIALAGGFNEDGNLRQVVVFRRDANWQLIATKLDLAGALYGKRPYPSDEIWLRDSDIVLIPPKPIARLSDAVDQYLTQTIYSIFPQQGVAFNFDDFTPL